MKTQSRLRIRSVARGALLLLCAGAISGFISCRGQRADRAEADADALVGLPQAEVRACAGRPNATRANGAEWIYVAGEDRGALGGRAPRFCEARVRFVDGAVAGVRYSGSTGALYGAGAECAPIFARC